MSGQADVKTEAGWFSAVWDGDQELVRVEWPGSPGCVYLNAAEARELAVALREVAS